MNLIRILRPYIGVAWKLALLVGLLIAASYMGDSVMDQLTPHLTPSTEPALHRTIMMAISVYVLLMMLPFVPGIEIGLGMMVMFGPKIVPLVYGATVLALFLAFLFGRLVPQRTIVEIFETLHLKRAGRLLRQLEPLESSERLEFLLQDAGSKVLPVLLRYRFLALMVALNLPGNALVGGGGGICLVAGFSRLFSFPSFLIAVALAVLPLPLMVFLAGS
jgi:hypothetical protein